MQRVLIAGVAARLMAGTWLVFWQNEANKDIAFPAAPSPAALFDKLPQADTKAPAFGTAPPTSPKAPKASREEFRISTTVTSSSLFRASK